MKMKKRKGTVADCAILSQLTRCCCLAGLAISVAISAIMLVSCSELGNVPDLID